MPFVVTTGVAPDRMPVEVGRSREDCGIQQSSDAVLIERFVSQGEERAFVALAERHLPRLRRLLFGLLGGNREDIQDVEQEILIALCGDLARFRFDSSFETYLYRFARNKAIDYIRRQARQRRIIEAVGARSLDAEETHAENVRIREERVEVGAILAKLTDEERLIVTLRELEGCALREIAKLLGLPEGTVKSRLHRIRKKIAATAGRDWQ